MRRTRFCAIVDRYFAFLRSPDRLRDAALRKRRGLAGLSTMAMAATGVPVQVSLPCVKEHAGRTGNTRVVQGTTGLASSIERPIRGTDTVNIRQSAPTTLWTPGCGIAAKIKVALRAVPSAKTDQSAQPGWPRKDRQPHGCEAHHVDQKLRPYRSQREPKPPLHFPIISPINRNATANELRLEVTERGEAPQLRRHQGRQRPARCSFG